MVNQIQTKWAAAFFGVTVLISLFVAVKFGTQYAQASYFHTVPAAIILGICNVALGARSWKKSHIASVTAFIMAALMFAFAIEESGWTAWRFYIRPVWFTETLSPFLKSVQSSAMWSNAAVFMWFFSGRSIERLHVVALLSAGIAMLLGTMGAGFIAWQL